MLSDLNVADKGLPARVLIWVVGVAILNEKALPIAAELLRSSHCEDRNLGLLILQDMDLLVARPHLDWLRRLVVCGAN